MQSFVFRTSSLEFPIVPRTPIDQEPLVHKGIDLIIDSYEEPVQVTVDEVIVYDSGLSPAFRNSWTGQVGATLDGYRIILTPPTVFSIGDQPRVFISTASYSSSYLFEVGTEQLTTTNDTSVPRIMDIDGTNVLVGYGRDTGYIYLRKVDPITSEVQLVIGKHFALGYDQYSNKAAVVFNINGSLFLTEANKGDLPNTLTDPTILKEEVQVNTSPGKPSSDIEEIQGLRFQVAYITEFPPIKKFLPDDITPSVGPGVYQYPDLTPTAKQREPVILQTDPPIVRIIRPSTEPERSALLGYQVLRYFPSSATIGGATYLAISEGEDFVDFEDTHKVNGVVYTVIPVYNFLGYGENETGPMSRYDWPDPTQTDFVPTAQGSGRGVYEITVEYEVVKNIQSDTLQIYAGAGRAYSVSIEGFGTIGIGS